ncbi:alternative ribosome-rescue factor A [Actinobacillus vicugnae]|uniref:alternative ribosome-rescue factor A n=1 Tax=Actinobacillus vicugnae TaxID=2573093 RepID=UPI001241509D|nr:ribosome alternative rescue factor ArfA [Actinobacillus vicugnae]
MKKALKTIAYQHNRGEIQENALKALVTDRLFKSRIERNRKGKGSYQRNAKHRKAGYGKGESPFKNVQMSNFKWAF